MNKTSTVLMVLGAISLGACSTTSSHRGSVAMKISETEAHVCLGEKETSVGMDIALFKNVCKNMGGRAEGRSPVCQKVEVGHGKVTQMLNKHYSVVKFDQGVEFEEGYIVETDPHAAKAK